jgi:osmotically-inducible protein OsmY
MQATVNLNEQVSSAIETSPYLLGRKLRFETAEGRVTLQGTVGSFYQKQMAQELVRHIDGVREIENQIEVTWC